MKEKTEDRRIHRTRNMILDAFLDLMIQKGYEKITVQNIIDAADVGRSTFYMHFTDKEQLLLSSIGQLREFLIEHGQQVSAVKANEYQFGFSLAMLKHAQSHQALYKAIVGGKGGSPVYYHMQQMLIGLIRDNVSMLFPGTTLRIPQKTATDFIGNTFMILLTWWMEQDMPCSAAEANSIFHALALNGLKALQR
jgi:AcrR family transcriptional regulator